MKKQGNNEEADDEIRNSLWLSPGPMPSQSRELMVLDLLNTEIVGSIPFLDMNVYPRFPCRTALCR